MIGWHFPPNNDGIAAGANDGAIDAFSGNKLSSIVREAIQNSLDAKLPGSNPVRVQFKASKVRTTNFSGFSEIRDHLTSCVKIARKQKLAGAVKFYENAIKKIDAASNVNLLCIQDENTTGLTGPIDEPWGSWFAMTKGAGISQKSNAASLGSYGHGSKALFAYSDARMIFYHTKINTKKSDEIRFQGKCILQTHEDPYCSKVYTQGTGFYGEKNGNKPLLNSNVPNWSSSLRDDFSKNTGTSIFVPYSDFTEANYSETKIVVLANFFYAIMTNELEVIVGDECITRENLKEVYEDCLANLNNVSEEIDRDHINHCFESIKTIINYDLHNAQEIANFGQVLWWIRVGDEIDGKNVGIARQNGMLITKKANGLERFRGTRNFDLFVCVKGDMGSQLLKELENPTHDNFEFDRIKFQKARTQAKRKYKEFTSKIREVIALNASISVSEEEELEGLSFIFGGLSDEPTINTPGAERGTKITLNSVFSNKGNYKSMREGELDYIEDLFSLNGRRNSTDVIHQTKSVKHVDEIIPVKEQTNGKVKLFDAVNLRVAHFHGNSAKIFFNSPLSGKCQLQIFAVGEHGSEPLDLVIEQETGPAIELFLESDVRHSVEVSFEKNVAQYVLEAKLHEI
jgi:hypothetical protein